MMSIKYLLMESSDKAILSELIMDLYKDDPDACMTADQINRSLDFLPAHPDCGSIIVFKFDSKIIGYSILINFYSNEYGGMILNIDELYVAPDYRSKGVASNFIKYLIDTNFNNFVALELEVLPYNKRALQLYERIGFKKSSRSYLMLKK